MKKTNATVKSESDKPVRFLDILGGASLHLAPGTRVALGEDGTIVWKGWAYYPAGADSVVRD